MEKPKKNNLKRNLLIILIPVILILAIGGGLYWYSVSKKIYIDKAEIDGPEISLAAPIGGPLEDIYVKAGDEVSADGRVARIGNQLVKAKVAGTILSIQQNKGELFNPGQTVATMINRNELRVIGQVPENEGLSEIKVGQRVYFNVDAYGAKNFYGIVDEISPVSRDASLSFSISDAKQVKDFDVKIRFDVNQNPELKPGMSAEVWVIK